MNEEQRLASDAQNLANNPAFKAAMAAMKDKLDANVAACDPDNKEKCSRVVVAVQILKGIERELERFIADGEVADIIEIETKRQLTVKERVTGMVR